MKLDTIKVVSYNIRHARGTDDKVKLSRIAGVLACSGGQLIGLQEVDKHLPRSFCFNQPKRVGGLLRKNWVFGPNLKWAPWGQYGNAVLSVWPVARSKQYLLPSRGEQRGLLEVEVNMGQERVFFFCTHLGLNQEERLEQVEEILKIIDQNGKPSILVGDFNDGRSSREFALLSEVLRDATGISGGFDTFPSPQPEEQLDFIFVSPQWQVIAARPIISQASDHLPVMVELGLNSS